MQSLKLCKALVQPFIDSVAFTQPCRTTYVVKRKFTAPLLKTGRLPSLRKRHRVYETLEDNTEKPLPINILLTKYVENVGRPGEVVSVKESQARYLLLTKRAEYPSEDNLTKAGTAVVADAETYSSRYVGYTIRELLKFVLNISMNKENPWTLEPWHIRSAFRKAHVHVPEECFTMPEEPIKGPDMNLEGKEFIITVTINKTEKVPVRCRIHHWTTSPRDRLPPVRDHWRFPAEVIRPVDEELVQRLAPIVAPELKPDDGPKHLRNKKKRFT